VGYAARKGLDSRLGRTDFLLTADTMAPEVYLLLSLQQQPSSAPGLLCNERQHAHARRRFDTRAPAGSRGAARGWGGLRELEARPSRRAFLEQESPASPSPKPPPTRRKQGLLSQARASLQGSGSGCTPWYGCFALLRTDAGVAYGVLITPARGVCAGAQAAGE